MSSPGYLFDFVIRLADNAMVLGQRLGELIASGPELEEEMATANFALDYIGQARMLYSYAGEIEDRNRDEDALAFTRDVIDYRNVLLVEQPNGDFAQTIARQFLFESFYQYRLQGLSASSNPRIAEIAVRSHKEILYHLRHNRQWLLRLGDGTEESHERMQTAIDDLWRYTGELFASDEVDARASAEGIAPDPGTHFEAWDSYVSTALSEATIEKPDDQWMAEGGRDGRHSEHLGYLLADMQFLQRAYPGAKW